MSSDPPSPPGIRVGVKAVGEEVKLLKNHVLCQICIVFGLANINGDILPIP